MIDVLSEEGQESLRRIALAPALLAFDFDGTLAPIVDRPDDAQLSSHTRALLRAVAMLYPCAVISGRARGDLAARLSGVPMMRLIGNHGAETGPVPPPPVVRTRVHAWAAALRDSVEGDGIEVEDKGYGVAVHFRRAADPAQARQRVLRLVSVIPGARVFGGRSVVNLVPIGAPTKADAIDAFAAELSLASVLFVGDDETDEDAFRSPLVTVGIRVGRSEASAAGYYVEAQPDVDRLLWALVSERARVSGLGGGWQGLDPSRRTGGTE